MKTSFLAALILVRVVAGCTEGQLRQHRQECAADASFEFNVVLFFNLALFRAAIVGTGIRIVDYAEVEGSCTPNRLDASVDVKFGADDFAGTDGAVEGLRAEVDVRGPHAEVCDAVADVDAALDRWVFAVLRIAAEYVVAGCADVEGVGELATFIWSRRWIAGEGDRRCAADGGGGD